MVVLTFNVKYLPSANVKYWATPNVKYSLPRMCKLVSLCDGIFAGGKYVIIRFGGENGNMTE